MMRPILVFPECRMDTPEYLRCFWVIHPQKNTLYFNSFIFYFYSYLLFFIIDSVFFHLLSSCKDEKNMLPWVYNVDSFREKC